MEARVINSETRYEAALAEAEELIALDPNPDSHEGERLALLSVLIENYEVNRFAFNKPTPLGAIRFRMEEQELNQSDLVPYIGSRSKVSEVLRGIRPLTLTMIRKLSSGLGIPADVLIQEPVSPEEKDFEWKLIPLKNMRKLGWIDATLEEIRDNPAKVLRRFLTPLGTYMPPIPLCKRTVSNNNGANYNTYALYAWACRVLIKAKEEKLQGTYSSDVIDEEFRRQLAQFSWSEHGPLLAKEFLANHGIALIIESHLDGSKLDGGALLAEDGTPVIGLTLRYDRIDNFWFVLLHELAHIEKHLGESDFFFDELDFGATALIEAQANAIARDSLIPKELWKTSKGYHLQSEDAVLDLAKQLNIHPAIIVGRLQFDTKNFTMMRNLLGQGKVRRIFETEKK